MPSTKLRRVDARLVVATIVVSTFFTCCVGSQILLGETNDGMSDQPQGLGLAFAMNGGPTMERRENGVQSDIAGGAEVRLTWTPPNSGWTLGLGLLATTLEPLEADSCTTPSRPSSLEGLELAFRAGYRYRRLHLWGGFAAGGFSEHQPVVGEEAAHRPESSYGVAGPLAGAGFTLFRNRSVMLEATAEMRWLDMTYSGAIAADSEPYTDDRRIITQQVGLAVTVFDAPTTSHGHIHGIFHCDRGCGAIISTAPRVGLELTRILFQVLAHAR
jgi:hypothetical protein